jgi:hypothetical protein
VSKVVVVLPGALVELYGEGGGLFPIAKVDGEVDLAAAAAEVVDTDWIVLRGGDGSENAWAFGFSVASPVDSLVEYDAGGVLVPKETVVEKLYASAEKFAAG